MNKVSGRVERKERERVTYFFANVSEVGVFNNDLKPSKTYFIHSKNGLKFANMSAKRISFLDALPNKND